ncbi:MAG: adenylate/guanylate cyclase domain-containing protein [Deltaproteobacteria bacterium]|nr:adenylate/guanylate cyclase domain-containing protein [Deltaproteobacteria bacterium]
MAKRVRTTSGTRTLRLVRGPSFVNRMLLVTLFLVLAATLASGASGYVVATKTVEDEIEFAGRSLVHGLSGSIVTIIAKPGAMGELQVVLNQSLAVDKEGRVADLVIVAKDLTVVAAKDPSQVGQKYSRFAGLKDIKTMQTVRLRGSGTRIVAPVQWGQTKRRTLGYVVITLSERAFAAARRGILVSFSALFLVASVATVFLTRRVLRRLLKPVVDLGDAARALAEGNSDYPLEPKSRDEIGVATHSFLKMRAAQRIFVRFSNPALVAEILAGHVPDVPVDAKLSVGFGDGVRFTDWSSAHTASDTSSFLTDYFTVFGQLVATHGGLIEKFIGDAVMTYYGLQREEAAQASLQALRTHVAGQHLLAIASVAFERYHNRRPLRFRFGLATGRCVVGPLGARGVKLDYTVIGDTVNLASRLEGLACPGGLTIDRFTYLNVDGALCLEAEGPTEQTVKGFDAPVCIYRVAGYRTAAEIDRLRSTVLDLLRKDEIRAVLRLTDEQFTELFAGAEQDLMGQAPLLPVRVT